MQGGGWSANSAGYVIPAQAGIQCFLIQAQSAPRTAVDSATVRELLDTGIRQYDEPIDVHCFCWGGGLPVRAGTESPVRESFGRVGTGIPSFRRRPESSVS